MYSSNSIVRNANILSLSQNEKVYVKVEMLLREWVVFPHLLFLL